MVYHHFASVKDVVHELVTHLKPRDTLAIADILHVEVDEGELLMMGKYKYMVAHMHGFTKEEMRRCLRAQGLRTSLLSTLRLPRGKAAMSSLFLPQAQSPLPNREKSVDRSVWCI